MVTTARTVVCLSLWLSVCQVSGSYVPGDMNGTIQNISQSYRIDRSRKYNGQAVFPKDALNNKSEGLSLKKVLLGSVLEAYEKLFGHMLNQLPTPSSGQGDTMKRNGLKKLLENIQMMKHRYWKEEKLLQELKKHRHIQMNDTTVQLKALQELPWLYNEASKLVDSQQRRRRHARRFRKHPRV